MSETVKKIHWLAVFMLATASTAGAEAAAPAGLVSILGGGPVYMHIKKNITELKKSGFNELIVWSMGVSSVGDLHNDYPLTSGGVYVGAQSLPYFATDLATIKSGTPKRVTFSIGSSNYGDWENIKALVDSRGTGPKSILYKDFAALKAALPIDAIDFDDENSYDAPSTEKFAVMLGKMGYKVTMDPYTNASYWETVTAAINATLPGTVDAIHLQTYAGGEGNNPCSGWDFGSVPVYPGVSDQSSAPPYLMPTQAEQAMKGWKADCGITGGWLWIFDQIAGTKQVRGYARAINKSFGR